MLTGAYLDAQARPGFSGTWVLNQDKSSFQPPAARPTRRVVTLDVKGDDVTHTTETTRTVFLEVEPFQEVSTTKSSYSAPFDGREHAVPNSSARVTLKRLNASTFERKAATGKASETGTWVLSPEGNTLTVSTKGMDESGMAYESVQVYERQ
jgi:hypothetical protein